MLTKPPSLSLIADSCFRHHRSQLQQRMASSCSSKSPPQIPILADSSSQQEERGDMSGGGLSSVAGGVVTLGKFDALHIGHRELAIQASKVGIPYLLSFVGMAEVFGWEPRAPIVAKCDRNRILSSWAPCCGNIAPSEFQIEFSSVRHLTPRQFVEKLSLELGVSGVVAGENYRFGYKAAGDASDLVRLCMEYGMGAYIVNPVMDKNQVPINMESSNLKERGQVSSTRVRHALAAGNMKYVSDLLGRKHRLVLMLKDQKVVADNSSQWRLSAPKYCLLNLPPKDGVYENCAILVGNEQPVSCTVSIDETYIHLDGYDLDLCNYISSKDVSLLGRVLCTVSGKGARDRLDAPSIWSKNDLIPFYTRSLQRDRGNCTSQSPSPQEPVYYRTIKQQGPPLGKTDGGTMKINCHAAFLKKENNAGVVVACRNSQGQLVEGTTFCKKIPSPQVGEALALCKARVAQKGRWRTVILETDCEVLFKACTDENYGCPWEIDAIVLDIISWLNQMQEGKLQLVSRQANRPPDWLAKAARERNCPCDWITNPPCILKDLLVSDICNTQDFSSSLNANLAFPVDQKKKRSGKGATDYGTDEEKDKDT